MNTSLWVKFLAAVLLFAAWGALVLMKLAPPDAFVFAIGQALVGLGVYHASTNNSAKAATATLVSGDAPVAAAAPAEPSAPTFQPQAAAAPATAPAPAAVTPVAAAVPAATLQ